ncbi:CLUMA_CG012389, isoform A [Clunio marinus]|uniref:CLUMA_CG012389, isoform A n=1 Tax=Clunio marinus TaxID=568069 RepID=A0A1J1IIN2_9DIPT|nr:CLUMA_CG012389, isoform A [Clunio marinus]
MRSSIVMKAFVPKAKGFCCYAKWNEESFVTDEVLLSSRVHIFNSVAMLIFTSIFSIILPNCIAAKATSSGRTMENQYFKMKPRKIILTKVNSLPKGFEASSLHMSWLQRP